MTYYAVDSYEPKTLRNQLADYLARTAREEYWYALVDVAFDYGVKPINWVGATALPVYHKGRLAQLADASPTLFPLTQYEPDRLQGELTRLLHHCRARPMLSFIRSALDLESLRERWQSVLEIQTDDGQSFVLRFADTRVLPALADVSEIWKRLAGGVTEWLYIGRDGALSSLEMPQGLADGDAMIRISETALSKLLKSGEVDALASMLDEHFSELLPAAQGSRVHDRLVQQAAMAEAFGLAATSERFALAVADFSVECHLLEHPEFSSWLVQRPWQTKPLEDALGDFLENHFMECAKP